MFFAADRTPPAGRNINYFRDDELTRLLYASDRTVDRDERAGSCSQRAQALIAELVPEIPLYNVDAARRRARLAAALQGQPDQHRHLLERPRVGDQIS